MVVCHCLHSSMTDIPNRKSTYLRHWRRARRRLPRPVDARATVSDNESQGKSEPDADLLDKSQSDYGGLSPDKEMLRSQDSNLIGDEFWVEIDRKNEGIEWLPSESDNDDEIDNSKFTKIECEEIAQWAVEHRITHSALESLNGLLRRHGQDHIPIKATTLLKTPTSNAESITQKSGMNYYCYSFEQELQRILKQYPADNLQDLESIDIGINIDGLPLFRSSLTNVWPVLCAVYIDPVMVFPVVLTSGTSKPKDLDFLEEFVDDLNTVLRNGVVVHNKNLTIKLRAIICDSPARAMVKNVKLCTGYFGCNHCTQKGLWLKKVTYPEVDVTMRTDTSFRNHEQIDHHHGNTPLSRLPIDMVLDFPLDYMHVSCIGVMKRLLLVWKQGPRATRLSATNILTISEKLLQLKPHLPSLFSRKPRSLLDVERWKATELRQFMLYTGKYVLQKVMNRDIYNNFLMFSVAMCLLVCPKSSNDIKIARELLVQFVTDVAKLYGADFMVFNVHALLHLPNDAERFGSLDKCSAFIYENYLQEVKKDVRSGKNPIVQLMNRHAERTILTNKVAPEKSAISVKRPNNAFILKNGNCGEIISIHTNPESLVETAVVQVYEKRSPFCMTPCDMTCINAYTVDQSKVHTEFHRVSELVEHAIFIPAGKEAVFMGLRHHK